MFAVSTVDTTGYNTVRFLHILCMIVAISPGYVWPIVSAALRKDGKGLGPDVGGVAARNTLLIHGPALVVGGFLGYGLVGMSKEAIGFGDSWITIAGTLWIIAIGVVFGLLYPAQKKAAAGDMSAAQRIPMFSGIMHLLIAGLLFLMVFQPGG